VQDKILGKIGWFFFIVKNIIIYIFKEGPASRGFLGFPP
jgi:hypothetical protein